MQNGWDNVSEEDQDALMRNTINNNIELDSVGKVIRKIGDRIKARREKRREAKSNLIILLDFENNAINVATEELDDNGNPLVEFTIYDDGTFTSSEPLDEEPETAPVASEEVPVTEEPTTTSETEVTENNDEEVVALTEEE